MRLPATSASVSKSQKQSRTAFRKESNSGFARGKALLGVSCMAMFMMLMPNLVQAKRTFLGLSEGGGRYRCGSANAASDLDKMINENSNMVFSQLDNEPRNLRMDEHMNEQARDYSEYFLTHTDMHLQQQRELDRREQDTRYPKIYINGAYAGSTEDIQRLRDEGKLPPATMTCKYKRGANVIGPKNLFE
jgi:hypothetical protein